MYLQLLELSLGEREREHPDAERAADRGGQSDLRVVGPCLGEVRTATSGVCSGGPRAEGGGDVVVISNRYLHSGGSYWALISTYADIIGQ